MQKRFNVTGLCIPAKHYMVNISDKVKQIKNLVDDGSYFTINRARQYGKTTTLSALRKVLQSEEYIVASLSFEGFSSKNFGSNENFCKQFMLSIRDALKLSNHVEYAEKWINSDVNDFKPLSSHITEMCRDKKVVLMIDEVDKTSNNQIFLEFISMLREKFMLREDGLDSTFHSVILAGVHDIRNIKIKLTNEGLHIPHESENRTHNSPWNIAVNFKVDMSFNPHEIAGMLLDYEHDKNTGMNVEEIAQEIYNYTSGYPFLVSRICQAIDEELNKEWTIDSVQKAVKILLKEENMLFVDLSKNLEDHKNLYNLVYDLLILGVEKNYVILNPTIKFAEMFAIVKEFNGKVVISNKIFALRVYDYLISKQEETPHNMQIRSAFKPEIIENGRFDMELCLRKFSEHYREIVSKHDVEFLERHGRLLFLTYIKPLINGSGFFNVEPEISDYRMDLTVEYGKEQFIVELKVWHGAKYEELARSQLANYLDLKGKNEGYLLTFDFSKGRAKRHKMEWIEYNGKRIFDVIV